MQRTEFAVQARRTVSVVLLLSYVNVVSIILCHSTPPTNPAPTAFSSCVFEPEIENTQKLHFLFITIKIESDSFIYIFSIFFILKFDI